jgi:hypothetical protein
MIPSLSDRRTPGLNDTFSAEHIALLVRRAPASIGKSGPGGYQVLTLVPVSFSILP